MPLGQSFMINGSVVAAPDEEVWSPIVIGDDLTSMQKRSPYQTLEWRKRVVDYQRLDWFDYDNTILASLICTPPGKLGEWERYTDAVCKQVKFRKNHSNAVELVAVFLVRAG